MSEHKSAPQSTGTSRQTSPLKSDNSSLNFLRFGSPTTTLIHIPRSIAVLKASSRRDLSKGKLDLKDLINYRATKVRMPSTYLSEEIVREITSLRFPIKSFAEVARHKRYFSLSMSEQTEQEAMRAHIEKVIQSDAKLPAVNKAARRRPKRKRAMESGHLPEESYASCSSLKVIENTLPMKIVQSYFSAVKAGNLVVLRKLLMAQRNLVNSVDAVGKTGMHWAAKRGDLETLETLLRAGGNINAVDLTNRTPLYIAARMDKATVVEYLLNAGADYTISSINDTTPQMVSKAGTLSRMYLARALDT